MKTKLATSVAFFCWTVAVGTMHVHAAPDDSLELSRIPLSVNASVPPNIVVSLDDSGSMAWGHMPSSGQTNAGSNCSWYNSAENTMYFNPALDYSPPLRMDGTQYPNSSLTNAWVDGLNPTYGTVNLTTRYRVTNNQNTDYSGGWKTGSFPSGVRSGSNERAFYCVGNSAPGDVRIVANQTAAIQQNFANWFSYYRFRSLAARSALSTAFARMDPSVRVAWQNFNNSSYQLGSSTEIKAMVRRRADGTDDPSWRNSFNSWLLRPRYSGSTPMRIAFGRAGEFYQRSDSNETNPYWDVGLEQELSCRQNFHVMMTDGYWNQGGPSGVGEYDNNGRALADGRSLTGDAARIYFNQTQRDNSVPNLADLAMYYYARDLRDDLDDNVPSYIGDRRTGVIPGATPEDEIYFNPANDPATWQRMVNFMVTFGAGSSLSNDDATLRALRRGDVAWPAARADTPSAIDDAWHAAVNSRGAFLSANNPQELVSALSAIMDNISRRLSVSGHSASSFFLRANEMEYESSYDSSEWSGDVSTSSLTGWMSSAAVQLDGRNPASRTVFTWRPDGGGPGSGSQVMFDYDLLSTEQKSYLDFNSANGTEDSLGRDRVAYLLGDRDEEQSNAGAFRNRGSIMGAVIGSNMVHVERPAHGYKAGPGFSEGGLAYAEFREEHEDRTPMLYVGANDGMLHALEAQTGREVWAFVPNQVMRNLSRLTSPSFQFVPTVNGHLTVSDIYDRTSEEWRTVLFGTLGLGGQAVYAIDITDPQTPRVLWEFSDRHDAQLGYNYLGVEITRIEYAAEDFRWVALVPSGYNNSQTEDATTKGTAHPFTDQHSSQDGPALFVVDAFTGQVLEKITGLGATANSLGGVTAGTLGDNRAAFAVAGDLNGNLWRFDMRVGSIGGVAKLFQGTPARPITVAPRIFPAASPESEMMIVFGSGKFLEDRDREIPDDYQMQAIYGVLDCPQGCSVASESDLVSQTIDIDDRGFLGLTQTLIPQDNHRGWMIPIGNRDHYNGRLLGERIIGSIEVNFALGSVILNSYVPSTDPCSPEGGTVLYIISAYTGGYLYPDPSDDNADGTANSGANASPVFGGDDAHGTDIGQVFVPGVPGVGGGGGSSGTNLIPRLGPNGCFFVAGAETNVCITPRRRGWRELPLE